jgi:hypothetical protein
MSLINIWQVYFNEKSKANCYPEYNHYDNSEKLTEYFENSVIVDLIRNGEHKKADYFGVWSHDIRKELVWKEGELRFSPANLEIVVEANKHIDIFGFQKRRENRNIILQAEHYHKGFVAIVQRILEETKFLPQIPKTLDHVILFNHFIAKSEVYEQYVNELLIPAMSVLANIHEAWNDANYKKGKTTPEIKARFVKAFGKDYYPMHPFILERLPSLFLQKYKLPFKHVF